MPFGRKEPRTRIFFATDVHGSDQCFRKWLNAARVYDAQVLILGGDVTGKIIVPLVANGDGVWRGEIYDEPVQAREGEELEALQKRIRTMGRYDVLLTAEEKAHTDAHPHGLDALFHRAMRESLERWVALAEERPLFGDIEGAHVLEELPVVHAIVEERATIFAPGGEAQLAPERKLQHETTFGDGEVAKERGRGPWRVRVTSNGVTVAGIQ